MAEPVRLDTVKSDAQTRMQKSVEALRHDLTKLRTGRASTALVDHLKVNYYGSDVPLSQVASVTIADARTLNIAPWEKNMVSAVEKAILASDLGLTPNTSGQLIRINLPKIDAANCPNTSRMKARTPRWRSATFVAMRCNRSRSC